MKKFFALMLAVLMLLSCVAFAEETVTKTENKNKGDNASITQKEWLSEYDTEENTWTAGDPNVKTEMWLQVDTHLDKEDGGDGTGGQIDVTVPLVLVFKTDINGGKASSPSNYQIINYSSADLVVTNLTSTVEGYSATDNPMKMVGKDAALTEDQYKAVLTTEGVPGEAGVNSWDLHADNSNADATKAYARVASQGGLFELAKGDTDAKTGTATDMDVTMETGKLSFVTARKTTTNEDGTVTDEMDDAKGIKLMTITYTVAIDTSDAIGGVNGTDAQFNITAANDQKTNTDN